MSTGIKRLLLRLLKITSMTFKTKLALEVNINSPQKGNRKYNYNSKQNPIYLA